MMQTMICNIGYRPILLTRFTGLGQTSICQMGIDDEPAAALGRDYQKFPKLLQPGETLKIHPFSVETLRRNMTDPGDPKVYFDPYRYFVVVDSFGRFHAMDAEDVLFELRILKTRKRPRGWFKVVYRFRKHRFLRSARSRIQV